MVDTWFACFSFMKFIYDYKNAEMGGRSISYPHKCDEFEYQTLKYAFLYMFGVQNFLKK